MANKSQKRLVLRWGGPNAAVAARRPGMMTLGNALMARKRKRMHASPLHLAMMRRK